MRIISVRVTNYMAFRDTGKIEFEPGFNIIIGKNNAGKSALLSVLNLQGISHLQHRSTYSIPEEGASPQQPESGAEFATTIDKQHINNLVYDEQGILTLPEPPDQVQDTTLVSDFIAWLSDDSKQADLRFTLRGSEFKPKLEVFGVYRPAFDSGQYRHRQYETLADGSVKLRSRTGTIVGLDSAETALIERLRKSVYAFSAERPHIGEYTTGTSIQLNPDASNLPEVINMLQPNPLRLERFNELVTRVLPLVRWVSVHPSGNDRLELKAWMVDRNSQRDDLAISLTKCGTGVGQVIAMLYVVFTAREPKIIVIDEPQSFLHPSAVRELMSTFREYPQHQYIIATHSPQVIAAAHPCRIIQITHDGNEASISQASSEDVEAVRSVLSDVGTRFSDIFGADRILWVEGPTEARCFPLILEHAGRAALRGIEIMAVESTGSFGARQKRHVREVLNIYTNLSGGQALLPPAVAFVFDRENRTDAQIDDLRREHGDLVRFLDRRMYENYLLSPTAIAAVLNEDFADYSDSDQSVSEETVTVWIAQHRDDYAGSLPAEGIADQPDHTWLDTVHGSNILEGLFADLADNTINYEKVHHGERLTRWLLENHPDELRDLSDFLLALLNGEKETQNDEA